MEYKVLKYVRLMKKYFTALLFINEDEFYFKKDEKDVKCELFHISYISDMFLKNIPIETPQISLSIIIKGNYFKKSDNQIIKLSSSKDNNASKIYLLDILNFLDINRLRYNLNIFLFNYKQQLKSNNDNKIILKFLNEVPINNNLIQLIDKINIEYFNKLRTFINKIKNIFPEKNNKINQFNQKFQSDIISNVNLEGINDLDNHKVINKFLNIYINLIKLLTLTKFYQILK